MDTLNFVFNSNQNLVDDFLIKNGYTKIGHKKSNIKGYCILINRKQYFEIENVSNPNIFKTSIFSDLETSC